MMSDDFFFGAYYESEFKKIVSLNRLTVTQAIDALKINQALGLQPQPMFE
jgi:hypothetical protein